MCTITKKDLIDGVCSATGRKRNEVKLIVQSFLDQIVEKVGEGNRIEFRDFGVFEIKQRASRTAQNPKTLVPVRVPPKRTVKFKVGRLMRERLDRGATEPVLLESVDGKHPHREPKKVASARELS
ncbi:MAG: HU family DNA-binding protein [Phycisphaerales bacterium]